MIQWLRIYRSMQGTQVRSLVWEDPTYRGATKPCTELLSPCAATTEACEPRAHPLSQLQIGTCQEHLPTTEPQQQEHLPSAAAETELCAIATANLPDTLRGIQGKELGTLCSRGTTGAGL